VALSTESHQYARLTMAQALVKHLTAQKIVTADGEQQLFGGAFAIFGH
jgi:3D-(3,5/4)-trihydroxycyclohexane-1,2-dione acylhydrolase (decyclizing)